MEWKAWLCIDLKIVRFSRKSSSTIFQVLDTASKFFVVFRLSLAYAHERVAYLEGMTYLSRSIIRHDRPSLAVADSPSCEGAYENTSSSSVPHTRLWRTFSTANQKGCPQPFIASVQSAGCLLYLPSRINPVCTDYQLMVPG